MQRLLIEKFYRPHLIEHARKLSGLGYIDSIADYSYLKIDDDYIHQIFPLLGIEDVEKPDCFSPLSIGAHISVIYAEESRLIEKQDVGTKHQFRVTDVFSTIIGVKKYYGLMVESPSLIALRSKYNLPEILCFKGYSINLHITIGAQIDFSLAYNL
jgi:hypothetical protein